MATAALSSGASRAARLASSGSTRPSSRGSTALAASNGLHGSPPHAISLAVAATDGSLALAGNFWDEFVIEGRTFYGDGTNSATVLVGLSPLGETRSIQAFGDTPVPGGFGSVARFAMAHDLLSLPDGKLLPRGRSGRRGAAAARGRGHGSRRPGRLSSRDCRRPDLTPRCTHAHPRSGAATALPQVFRKRSLPASSARQVRATSSVACTHDSESPASSHCSARAARRVRNPSMAALASPWRRRARWRSRRTPTTSPPSTSASCAATRPCASVRPTG